MIRTVFLHTIKLLSKGKETMILLLGGIVLMLFLVFGMDEVKEEKSKISIGLVDEDASAFSEMVVKRIRDMELFEVVSEEKEFLLKRLSAGELSAVCVIREGYMELVTKGDTDDVVLIYQTEEGILLLPDVLAAAMLEEICSAKGYQVYLGYAQEGKQLSYEEYQDYIRPYVNGEMFDFSFDISYRNTKAEGVAPGNEVIYVQAIFAIAALMMSFLAVYGILPYHRMLHGVVRGRMASLPLGKTGLILGNAGAVCVFTGVFSMLFVAVFTWRNGLDFSVFLSFLICTGVYVCVIVAIMMLAGTILRSEQGYVVLLIAVVLLFGMCGFFSIVDGVLLPEGMSTWTPNGWYVRKMTEIYLR